MTTEPTTEPTRRKGTRLDPEFIPSLRSRQTILAERPEIDLRAEHARFVAHYEAKRGPRAFKLDWDAAWRNWMRHADRIAPRHPAPPLTKTGQPRKRNSVAGECFRCGRHLEPDQGGVWLQDGEWVIYCIEEASQ